MLNQCLESLVQKVQSGVVINFEKTGPDPPLTGEGEFFNQMWRNQIHLHKRSRISCPFCLCFLNMFNQWFTGLRKHTPFVFADNPLDPSRPLSSFSPQLWHSCHKLIYVRPNPKTGVPVGHWPIPESFWPDQNSPTLVSRTLLDSSSTFTVSTAAVRIPCNIWPSPLPLPLFPSQPPRSAHPMVRFSCVDCEPMVIDKLPFDKYELEPSPLTQYILERKSPHMCWQVGHISNTRQLSLLVYTPHTHTHTAHTHTHTHAQLGNSTDCPTPSLKAVKGLL